MKINSEDQLSWISIEHHADETYSSHSVSVQLRGFSGKNDDVHFLDLPNFVDQLRRFAAARSGLVRLEGSEDFQLVVEAIDSSGHLWVVVDLCSYQAKPNLSTQRYAVSGGFQVSSEMMNSVLTDFERLLAANKAV